MKLILENWKKFIVEGFSEQEQSRYKSIIPIADKLKEASQKFIENLKIIHLQILLQMMLQII